MSSISSTAGTDTFRYSPFSLFAAGFIAVLVFHQGAWAILNPLGFAPPPFPARATWPMGIPQVWSLAFWGGVWGIAFGAVERRFPEGGTYWVYAFLFGAILPTLVLWFVVFPLKGIPVAGGWNPASMFVTAVVHGIWGLGTAGLLRWRP